MNVREIVIAHLNAGGFDGLCCDGCGCGMDDLIPCDGDAMKCVQAKRHDCDGTCTGCCSTGQLDRVADCYRTADTQTNEEETHL
jgi:hypothetical protein